MNVLNVAARAPSFPPRKILVGNTFNPKYMMAAIRAGQAYRGNTWPNPSVGCVLVNPNTNQIIASGATQLGGRPHAEVDALTHAGENARGCIAYITLEPCAHTSEHKPTSCADALINAGVSAVAVAMLDPNPKVMGKGLQKLHDAGIETHTGLHAEHAYHAHRGHITRTIQNRPYITLKMAHSADNMIARTGERTTITCEQSWNRTFLQRSKVDAVMIGIETALIDNPQLTDRGTGNKHQPVRIVIDTHARLPVTAKMINGIHDAPVWIVTSENADTATLERHGVKIIHAKLNASGHIDMHDTLKKLMTEGLGHIFIEGGAKLASTMLEMGVIDEALIIEGENNIGDNGVPMPPLPATLNLRNTDEIGVDTWRIYDSEHATNAMRDFFVQQKTFLQE